MASRTANVPHRPPASYARSKRTFVRTVPKPSVQDVLKSLRTAPRFNYTSEFESVEFEVMLQERWRRGREDRR